MSDRLSARWIAGLIGWDDEPYQEARRLAGDGLGSPLGFLRARRYVESQWLGRVPFTGRDFEEAARIAVRGDRWPQAWLLAGMASTEKRLAAAARRWGQPEEDDVLQPVPGLAHVESVGRGVDGAFYTIGSFGRPGHPVVVVHNHAGGELLAGWPDSGDARGWARSRLASAAGPLREPGLPDTPRLVYEERLLAVMLRYQWLLGGLRYSAVFASPIRCEIAEAAKAVRRRGPVDTSSVRDELARRLEWAPEWVTRRYGGSLDYVRRLAVTDVPLDRVRVSMTVLGVTCADPHPASAEPRPVRQHDLEPHPAVTSSPSGPCPRA